MNPFSSYSFHPFEAVILGAWVLPVVVLVPVWVPLLGVLQGVGLANNLVSHLGYELYPRGYVRWWPTRWLTSSTYHNLHHSRLSGNYGLMFRFWDRALGTEVADYEEKFVASASGGSRAPTAEVESELR